MEEERRAKQKDADEEYTKDMEDLKEQIDRRDEDKKEDIADHLRWYIEDWYRKVGELPAFPEPTPILPHDLLGFPKGKCCQWSSLQKHWEHVRVYLYQDISMRRISVMIQIELTSEMFTVFTLSEITTRK